MAISKLTHLFSVCSAVNKELQGIYIYWGLSFMMYEIGLCSVLRPL